MFKFPHHLLAPAIIGAAAIIIIQANIALTLTRREVNAVAKQITVQINGETSGSGFILERRGNTYYVVTNRHVAEKPGRYEITTADGQIYPVYYSDTIPDLDLMVLQFETSRSYTTAKLGNSHGMMETDEVYIAGWTAPDALPGEGRGYEFTEGRITTIKGDAEDGYSFVGVASLRDGV